MNILKVATNKKQYLDLLLLADEQENMIDRYLERGEMFALSDGSRVLAEMVVTDEGNGVFEVKNLAVAPDSQGQGYGRAMLDFAAQHYRGRCRTLLVGTGESPLTLLFYEKCGFSFSHRVKDFFIENYDHPMYEAGAQLVDMIYLKKDLLD